MDSLQTFAKDLLYNELEGKGFVRIERTTYYPTRVSTPLHFTMTEKRGCGCDRITAKGLSNRANLFQNNRTAKGRFEVLDGQQRITSIGRFVTGKIRH